MCCAQIGPLSRMASWNLVCLNHCRVMDGNPKVWIYFNSWCLFVLSVISKAYASKLGNFRFPHICLTSGYCYAKYITVYCPWSPVFHSCFLKHEDDAIKAHGNMIGSCPKKQYRPAMNEARQCLTKFYKHKLNVYSLWNFLSAACRFVFIIFVFLNVLTKAISFR